MIKSKTENTLYSMNMIKVRVYPPPFSNPQAIDEDGYVELFSGALVKDLIKELDIPFARLAVLLCKVNYQKAKAATPLQHGDTVSFITAFAGG